MPIEVNGTCASYLLQDATTQSTGTCEDRMTSFDELLYHVVGCTVSVHRESHQAISCPTLDPEKSNVRERISLRN